MIIIDAGHGGKDPGAVGQNGTKEKDVVLKISKWLALVLEKMGYDLRLTREDDTYPSWGNRVESKQDDLFISIHCNAVDNQKVKGVETWHFSGSENGQKLAKLIQENIINNSDRRDRGIKHNKKFYVLRKTRCPAVLVEIGFISNLEEEKAINSINYQAVVVSSIVDAIEEYKEG